MVLKSASFCSTQIVGTTAGGMTRPDRMTRLRTVVHRLLRRWRTKAAIAATITTTVTLATVRIVLLMKATMRM